MIGLLSLAGYNKIIGQTVENTFITHISTVYRDTITPMYISLQPMTGSYVNSAGENVFYTATGTVYTYNCAGDTINSEQVHDFPIYQRGGNLGTNSGFNVSHFGDFKKYETVVIDKNFNSNILEYKLKIEYSEGYSSENHFDKRSPYSSLLYSSSFSFGDRTSRVKIVGSDASTYLTINITTGGLVPTCFGNQTLTNISFITGTTTSYTGSVQSNTFINREQDSILNFFETITKVDAELQNTTSYFGGINVLSNTYNLSGLNFKQESVYTENKNTNFSILKSVEISGSDSIIDVSYKDEPLSLGAYFDTHYIVGECETVYSALWDDKFGETVLFKDIFNNVGNGFIVNGDSVKKHFIRESSSSSYKPINASGDEVGITESNSYKNKYNAAYYNSGGSYWKPLGINFSPKFSYKEMSGIQNIMYKAYSDLSKKKEEGFYKTYNIEVNRTLNSKFYSNEYLYRKSGIIGSFSVSNANIVQVALANSNDVLKMKESIDLISYLETENLPKPWGGNNYFFTDPTTILYESGAYSYTSYDMNNKKDFTENSFKGQTFFKVSNNNILNIESLCVIIYGTTTEEEDTNNFIGPAGTANSLVAISKSYCNNMASVSDFYDEMITFNAMNFPYIDRKTEQTFYPITPGFII